jgi:hypothetical protein
MPVRRPHAYMSAKQVPRSRILPSAKPSVQRRFSAKRSNGWRKHHGEVFRDLEFARGVPAGLVENDHGVRAGCNRTAYLFEVFAHRRRVGIRHDDGDPGVATGADGAEQIGILITLIFWLPRTRTLLGPLVDERVLLPDPHFILEPHLDRGCQGQLAYGLTRAGKLFFKGRNGFRILLGVPRSGADMRKAKLPETTPQAHLGQINAKPRAQALSGTFSRAQVSQLGIGPLRVV